MPGWRPRHSWPAGGRRPVLAAVAVALAGSLIVAHAARSVTFSADDWTFILYRRGFTAGVFLRPHNEHLSALPIAAYKLLLALFGAGSYVPFMALLLTVHGIACLLLYAIARRYVGGWVALVPTAILAVLGPAWQDLLWAFQIGYVGSVAAGLGMLLCLDRADRRREAAAACLLSVSLLCSSIGLAMAVLALGFVVLDNPVNWRRLWVVVVPIAIYAVWYAVYGVSTIRTDNIGRIPKYVAQALSAALGSVTGLAQTHVSPYLVSTSYGRFVALAAVLLLALLLLRGRRFAPLAWAATLSAAALWIAEGLEYFPGGREAAQSRYQYAAAALVLLAASAAARGVSLGPRSGALLAMLTLLVCVSNISMLDQRSGFWSANGGYVDAEIGAMEVARGAVSPSFMPENFLTVAAIGNHNISPVEAGPYFSATDAFGSSADSVATILRQPEKIREAADLILGEAEHLRLEPVAAPTSGRSCRTAKTGAQLGDITAGPGSLTISVHRGTVAALELRRFASGYRFIALGNEPPPFARVRLSDGEAMRLELVQDGARIPWHGRLAGGSGVLVCRG